MPEIIEVDTAIKSIPLGGRILIGSGAAVPTALMEGLSRYCDRFHDNEVTHLMLLGPLDFIGEEIGTHLRDNSLFIGDNVRGAVQKGFADYTPIFLSEIPRLMRSGNFPISVALIQVTPPDENGICSLGLSVDIIKQGIESAKIVIAQVNPQMPRTFGEALVPYKNIDYVVEASRPIPELQPTEVNDTFVAIARNVASLIPDGSVLQLGIGAIPDAILTECSDKNDLGIHTEMLSDGVMDLMKRGNITNHRKRVLRGRSLTSFAMGTSKLYDYLNDNPLVEFYPSDYVNDPYVISQNDHMISINSALQVDLTGQICADSLGPRFYSGIGGQVDFIRGASRSLHGKPIIALPSTAKDETISRIVGHLADGAGVVTTRGDIHYVVTEFGVARLHGKSIRQRALELIRIAHPKFRPELLEYVKEAKYVYFDQALIDPENHYPTQFEEERKFGEKSYKVRPIRTTDEKKLQDFFYSHNIATLYHRYLKIPLSMDHATAQKLIDVDYQRKMALVILAPGEFDDQIVAIGRLEPTSSEDLHDLFIVIGEQYRKLGMGFYLCSKIIEFARKQNLNHIRSVCRITNAAMKKILNHFSHNMEGSSTYMKQNIASFFLALNGKRFEPQVNHYPTDLMEDSQPKLRN